MLRSLYTAATGMEAQQTKMDVIAHNLANASTTGFKRERAEFADLLSDTIAGAGAPDPRGGAQPASLQVGLGVKTTSTTRSFSQGDMMATQGPTDLTIQGSGLFRVLRPNGEAAYTRAGNLRIDATGRLVTQHGETVDPGISVPAETTQLTIGADGAVQAKVPGRDTASELGSIHLAMFANPGGLEALGGNLFAATEASGQPSMVKPGEQGAGALSQGYLETSNVKAVEEMVEMISTQRAYEMNSKVIQSADQMLQRLTSLR
jgi:flagellar basal-body rod protein FlgG